MFEVLKESILYSTATFTVHSGSHNDVLQLLSKHSYRWVESWWRLWGGQSGLHVAGVCCLKKIRMQVNIVSIRRKKSDVKHPNILEVHIGLYIFSFLEGNHKKDQGDSLCDIDGHT